MKKMLSMALSVMMVSACLPGLAQADANYQTANEDGVYILTPDNVVEVIGDKWATDNETIYRIADDFSSYEVVPEHSVVYGFDYQGEENVGYDLWVLSTYNDNGVSTPLYAFDDDEPVRWGFDTEGWNNQTVSPYTNDLAGSRFELFWSKVKTNITFTKGQHTLKYSVDRRWFDKYVISCYGGAVLVPSSYNWTPSNETVLRSGGKSTIDKGFSASYAWIELEKYKTFSQFVGVDDPAEGMEISPADSYSTQNGYSGNGCLLMEGAIGEAKYTYDFRLDNTDSYDIWFLGTEFAMHLSDFDWGIDIANDTELIRIENLNQYNSDVVYNATQHSFPVKWQKVAQGITINEGQHEFTYKQNYRYVAADRWGQADCIAIVPSDLNWQPTNEDKADVANANLDAKALAYGLNKEYQDGLDNNVVLPNIGPAGSRYSYESLTPDVISSNGAIFPSTEDDLEAQVKISATKNSEKCDDIVDLVVNADENAEGRIENKVYVMTVEDVVDVKGSQWASDYETIYRVEKDFGSEQAEEHSISFKFDYEGNEDVSYDVWILSTFNDNSLSTPMYSFDNDEPSRWAFVTNGWNNQSITPFFNYLAGLPFDLYWSKAATHKTFTNGEHILKYTVGTRWFDNWMLSCVSGAVLVPSSYNWTPDNKTLLKTHGRSNVPTDYVNPYALIELENFKSYTSDKEVVDPCVSYSNSNTSGNGCLNMEGADGEVTYQYDFELDNTGVYDIWILGTDIGWSPLSNFKWGVDTSDLTQSQKLSATDSLYPGTSGGFAVMWQKAAQDVVITSGNHTFTYKQLYRQDGPQRWGLADCIAIVPKGFEWEPTTDDIGAQISANLDSIALWYTLDRKYAKGTKENIYMPQAGPAGSTYTYESLYTDIIDENGVINQTGEEQQGIFVLKATKNGLNTGEQYLYITVLPLDDVVVKEFRLLDSEDKDVTTLVPNQTVKAQAKVADGSNIKTNAIMVLAVYNANGSLNSVVKSESKTMTIDYQTLEASVTLPENVDGMTVKAYIWNDLNAAMPLTEAISNVK